MLNYEPHIEVYILLKQKSRFFLNILIPIMFLGSLIIGGFSLYIYHATYQNLRRNAIEERYNYIRQAEGTLEQKIKTIEYSFSAYSSTKSFQNIINRSLNYKDFQDVKNVNTELSYISSLGNEDTTYSLISLKHQWEISNGSLYQLTDTEINRIQRQAQKADAPLFWQKGPHGIQMMVTLPFYDTERSAIGAATISDASIKNIVTDNKITHFGIISPTGKQLFQNQKFITAKTKNKILQQSNNNTNKTSYTDKSGNIYIYAKSDYNNWTYVTRINHSVITHQISTLALGLLIIFIMMIGLLYLVAYLIAEHSAKPIREISHHLEISPATNVRQKNEITNILGGIDKIVSENELLNQTINYQRPELENLFVLNLYRNYIRPDEITKRLEQFGYTDIQSAFFATILIQIDDYGTHTFAANDLLLMAIENIVTTLISNDERLRPVLVNRDTQATTLIFKTNVDIKKQLLERSNEIQAAVRQALKIKISLGISNVYQDLKNSKDSVDNAKEALRFRLNLGEESIILYDEVAPKLHQTAIIKNPESRNQVLDAIRAGDKEKIKELFPLTIQQIFNNNTNPLSAKTSILRLVGDIIQLGQLLGVDFELSRDIRNIYYSVITIDNQNQLSQLLYHSLVDPLVNRTSDKTNNDLQTLSEKMIQIVHSRYDEDISLDSIADELHYNANYLSSVFKKEFGTNFSDYLQNYRMEVAKKWLVETNLTIKEIAEKLCYNNPQNFIRFFKKRENITPGAYRRHNKID